MATDNTIPNPTGIIKVGSGDPDIIYENTMLTLADITGTGLVPSAGIVFDSVKGVAGQTGCVEFEMDAIGVDFNSLELAGQLSVDIEAYYMSKIQAPDSVGFDHPTGNHNHLQWNATSGTAGSAYGQLFSTAGEYLKAMMNNADSAGNSVAGTSSQVAGSDGMITVTLSWYGTKLDFYINGLPVITDWTNPTGSITDAFKFIRVGSLLTDGQPVEDCHYRNFVVSKRPVMMAGHHKLRVAGIGDSYFANAPVGANWQSNPDQVIDAYFANRGIDSSVDLTPAVSGENYDSTAVGKIEDQIPDALALNPYIVICQGGANDVLNDKTLANTQSGLENIVTDTLVAGGGVQHIVFSNCPDMNSGNGFDFSGSPIATAAAVSAKTIEVNALINAMPAWGDANGFAGRVHVVDTYAAFGGELSKLINFLDGNNHPSGAGYQIIGNLLAKKVATLIG